MAGTAGGDDEDITGINVTPLVDVMLVLLIIFMVTANYMVNKGIDVNLPAAETGEDKVSSKNLAFVLDKDSNLYLDGNPIEYEQMSRFITEARADAGAKELNLQALISADTATPHGAVVKLIDEVRKNGINDFALNVEAPVPAETESATSPE